MSEQRDIFDLWQEIKSHPEFVFGTIFVLDDFEDRHVSDHFDPKYAEDRVTELGNELISMHL